MTKNKIKDEDVPHLDLSVHYYERKMKFRLQTNVTKTC